MIKLFSSCLILSLSFSVVLCDLDKQEGSECEWDGVKGTCVNSRRCFTTLDTRSEEKNPICSKNGEELVICCTDCELVNDTRNAIVSPKGTGLFWKDGRKSRDHCLQYWDELPYRCLEGGFYGGVKRQYNEEKKCHGYSLWAVGGAPPIGAEPGAEYPHLALLGYGDNLDSVKWQAGGSVISDSYILTAAHVIRSTPETLKYVALGVKKLSDSHEKWQIHEVIDTIPHPNYTASQFYNDIALLKTNTIQFNKNVLPACLPSERLDDDEAVATTWRKADDYHELSDTIRSFKVQKYTKEECASSIPSSRKLPNGYDQRTQMCYGNKEDLSKSCNGFSGEPLMVDNHITRCIYTVIGITSFGPNRCGPDVYTKVSHYVPWIESVVWP